MSSLLVITASADQQRGEGGEQVHGKLNCLEQSVEFVFVKFEVIYSFLEYQYISDQS